MENESSKAGKVGKVIANVFLVIIFVVSMMSVIVALNSNNGGVPNIFGFGYLSVQSDSMTGTFEQGDLVFIHTTTPDDEFEIGDVVTFYDSNIIPGQIVLNTHRIVAVAEVGDVLYYTTRGDKYPGVEEFAVETENPFNDSAKKTSEEIVAIYTGTYLTGAGVVFDFMQSSTGFFIVVVLPLAALFIYQVINFALVMARFRKEETDQLIKNAKFEDLDEEAKAEIARKYLESLKQKEEAESAEKAAPEEETETSAQENAEEKTEEKTEENKD